MDYEYRCFWNEQNKYETLLEVTGLPIFNPDMKSLVIAANELSKVFKRLKYP